MSSIDDLAPEIVIHILEHVVDPSEWTINHLRTLALVSKYFLSIVTSAPSLWAVARFGGPTSSRLEDVNLALQKSKEAPLTVILEHDTAMTGTDATIFMTAVVRHSCRWRAARFHSRYTRLIKDHLANLDAPMLESFAYNQDFTTQYAPRMFALGGMNMRHLVLAGVGAMGSTTQLCGLRTLSLKNLPRQFEVTSVEIVTIISSCPLLEELSINAVNTIRGHNRGTASLRPIVLRHLHKLELRSIASTLLTALMTRIEAEHLKYLHVTTAAAESSHKLLRLLAEKETTMGRFLSSVHFSSGSDCILISETANVLIMGAPQPSIPAENFRLFLSKIPLSTACHCLSTILPRLPLSLFITQDTTYPLQVFERTHTIVYLSIKNGSGRNILTYLAQPPDTRSDGSHYWHCPGLKLLRISGSAYDENVFLLATFLTERYKHLNLAKSDKENVGQDSPVHFVALSGPVLPARSTILILTLPKLPGIYVWVEAVKDGMYIIMTKIPQGRRVTMCQRCVALAISAFLSLLAFTAVIIFPQ